MNSWFIRVDCKLVFFNHFSDRASIPQYFNSIYFLWSLVLLFFSVVLA